MDGEQSSIEARWEAVGSRDRATALLTRARLQDLAREGERDAESTELPSLEPLRAFVDRLRGAAARGMAKEGVEEAARAIEADEALRAGVHRYVARFLRAVRVTGALADLGIFPAHGFYAELRERITTKVLPSFRPPRDLAEALSTVFRRHDAEWIDEIGDDAIARLLHAMAPTDEVARASIELGTLRAIDLLSHRLAAAGEDPILHRFDPESIEHESPFLAQADLVLGITASRRARLTPGPEEPSPRADEDHARVLLTQCRDTALRFRRRAPRTGATVRLGYELARIRDLIERITLLLATLHDSEEAGAARAGLVRTLVRTQGNAERVWPLLARASHLVAGEVVSHAGRTGDHYITRTARDYGRMWVAAAGGGAIIAVLAAIKVGLTNLHAPLLIEAALFSANYAIGFIVVQALGLTIATKQPAMTAAALASSVDGMTQRRDTRPLVETVMCLVRSQVAAIAGNVAIALPVALALGMVLAWMIGAPIASPEKASDMVLALDPLASPAIAHAAITGVWLAFSGIVAGYAANSSIARHVPDRIARSAPLQRWLGRRNVERLARWSERSAGAWAGCLALGVLLGSTGTVGYLLGLPLDIRHVGFSSANLGIALATLGFGNIPWGSSLAGIVAIGFANLTVSFGLSLGLALHARGRRLRELPGLAQDLARSAVFELYAWLVPIGRTATPVDEPEEPPGAVTPR
ncbi:MAG: site-specific recombinase [Myxococcota bacterium]|nr:site-specific recombinase [Myxococcota bacterium]